MLVPISRWPAEHRIVSAPFISLSLSSKVPNMRILCACCFTTQLKDAVVTRALVLLKRPAILQERKPIENRFIEDNETLAHFDKADFVFTDIDYGVENKVSACLVLAGLNC